ncbi:IclR family transcriptional regulator [Haloglycomyces albus]|uniref:IclR family transcriptional regulator n=1 Tax=Haloglycomyces albus TaxID=526067 RepID=UPI00046D6AB6|nr:IclR family transcriptional regulator [Haloglycomyces albus]
MAKHIQSIERAAEVLKLLAKGSRPYSLAEIANNLDLPKPTAIGILRTLQSADFIDQDPETSRYGLGPAVLHVGARYLDGNELRTKALNWSDSLATRSGESVRIATPHHDQALVVHHVFRPDDSHQTLTVGELLPLNATAIGKVLLAYGGTPVEEIVEEFAEYTPQTVADRSALADEGKRIRAQGWAEEIEEYVVGETSIAAPIRDRQGIVIGAIAITGAIERTCENGQSRMDLVSYVRDAARAISRELGCSPHI